MGLSYTDRRPGRILCYAANSVILYLHLMNSSYASGTRQLVNVKAYIARPSLVVESVRS